MSSAAPATTLPPADAAALAALRLPLVPRSKLACGPLDARIARACRLARAASVSGLLCQAGFLREPLLFRGINKPGALWRAQIV